MSLLVRVTVAGLFAALLSPIAPAGGSAAGIAGCDPEILTLPPLAGDSLARVNAMNDRGWVIGGSWDATREGGATVATVLWRDTGPPVDLGIGGAVLADGSFTSSNPADVNENGVIAVNVSRLDSRFRTLRQSSYLWQDGTKVRLPAGPVRSWSGVTDLNENDVAVGYISRQEEDLVPVVWRDGQLDFLPRPRGATGVATGINQTGLIVGWINRGGEPFSRIPWWWRGRRNGPLRVLSDRVHSTVAVDDRDRIFGWRQSSNQGDGGIRPVMWRGTEARSRFLFDEVVNRMSIDDYGDVAGSAGGFRGIGEGAYLARVGDSAVTMLPAPETSDPDGWANVYGAAVGRGVTTFAPHGGISVAGHAYPWEGGLTAVLWTCAQTYLP